MSRSTELGELEQTVLLAVWHLADRAYGLTVRDEIARRTGKRVSVSTAYLTMARLEEKGLLRSRLADPRPIPGGKARRYFSITTRGIDAVRAARSRMDRMWRGLDEGDRVTV